MGRPLTLLGTSLVVAMALPMTAHAESRVLDWDAHPGDADTCSPARMMVFPAAGSVPANLPFIELIPSPSYSTLMMATLTRRDTLDAVPFHVAIDSARTTMRVALDAPLVPGATYDFLAPPCGTAPRASFEYIATEARPLPTSLGELQARIYATYPALGEPPRYFVEATLVPDASIAPWFGFYACHIIGEGMRDTPLAPRVLTNDAPSLEWTFAVNCWTPESLIGPFLGIAQFLSGGDTGSVGTPYTREQRSCSEAVVVDSAGVPLTPEQIRRYEDALRAATLDAGPADAATRDAGPSSIDGGHHTEPDTNPNCGCTTASTSRTPRALLALVLSGLALVTRRRRHAR